MALVKRLKASYDICSGSELLNQEIRNQIHFGQEREDKAAQHQGQAATTTTG